MPYESMHQTSWTRRRANGLLYGIQGRGIDVGAGSEPAPWWDLPGMPRLEVDTWDREDGDAHDLVGVGAEAYDFLFSSHLLEHLEEPERALANWVRVVRHRGVLLIAVPHRDLYERRLVLPSRWNPDHKRFYLPYHDFPPDTVGLYPWLQSLAEGLGFEVLAVQTGDWGWTPVPENCHPVREYQIDALLRRVA